MTVTTGCDVGLATQQGGDPISRENGPPAAGAMEGTVEQNIAELRKTIEALVQSAGEIRQDLGNCKIAMDTHLKDWKF